MNKGKSKVSVVAMMAVLASLLLPVLAAPSASAADASHVNSTLAGCKPTAGSYTTTPQVICTNNGNYTTGNLGKSWNELDLVPYRMTLSATNAAPATQTYTISIVLDGVDAGKPGYDVISVATLNTALSDDSATNCLISSGPQSNKTPGFGGTDTSIYRKITITQQAGTTCVFDFYGRLALGSHLFPGSSLHANDGDEAVNKGGSDVSIPVNEISPQELRKTMSALQDSDVSWDITKEATPAHLDFENVCDPAVPASLTTEITVTWTKNAAVGGNILVTTHIFAKNPAARPITTNVTDVIKSGTTVLDTKVFAPVVVPANTETEILPAHSFTVPAGTTSLNDTATATYTDTITNIAIPGSVVANATAIIQGGNVTNDTAVITDTEDISGAGLSFSVDNVTGDSAGATFGGGYQAGDITSDPVDWTSAEQSASGSVTFEKTIYLDASGGATSGSLDDTATLTGSDGFTTDADASVDVQSTLSGSLVINKTTSVPVDGDTTFEFNVTPGDIPVTVTILDGQTSGSSDALTGLAAGDYTVSETNSNGFTPAADQDFTIGAGSCSAELDFENTFGPATLQAFKITDPAGAEAGWVFTVTLDGNPFDTGTTDATGTVQWDTAGSDTLTLADEGHYVVTETEQAGYVSDGGKGDCDFTVDFPGDADKAFACTFTNTKLGSITIEKVTSPDPDPTDTSFEFTRDFGTSPVSLKNGGSDKVSDLAAGTYKVEENTPAGWDLTTAVCSDGSDPAAIELAAGEDVTCTFTNTQQTGNIIIKKVTSPTGSTQAFTFDTDYKANFDLKDGESDNSGDLPPGTYSAAEINIPTGWTLKSSTCDDGSPVSAIVLGANETVTCTFTNEQSGTIEVRKTVSGGNSAQTFVFELRKDAADSDPGTGDDTPGTLLNSPGQTITANNTFVQLNGSLAPGTYQVCELLPAAGWTSDLGGANQFTLTLGGDNSRVCTNVDVAAGAKVQITVNNTPPPGGAQLTIGFWKNHASCKASNGKQKPVLDQTLAQAGTTTIGTVSLTGSATDCVKAVNILNKTTIDGKTKKASDPLFNMAAQLLAAKLNVTAGAGTCPASTTAITQAQALLVKYGWNGLTYSPKLTAADATLANQLNTTLDQYNNGLLC